MGRGLGDQDPKNGIRFFYESDLCMDPLTWKALAAKLETSLQSLHRWRQMDDAPTEPNLDAWQAFKTLRTLGRDRPTSELAVLKAELLREQIKRERARNRRESGDVIDREVVEAMLVTVQGHELVVNGAILQRDETLPLRVERWRDRLQQWRQASTAE